MRHWCLVGAGLGLAFVVSSARAADLAILDPQFWPTFGWTGLYIGANSGLVHASAPGTTSQGAVAGGQLGFNFQIAKYLLVGVEGDASATTMSGTYNTAVLGQPFMVTSRDYAIGTGRARAGAVLGQFLFYGTGGLGWTASTLKGTLVGISLVDARIHTGLTYGGGAEWHFLPMLTARAEYLHAALGSQTYFSGRVATGDIAANVFRLSINYLR